jgi:tetratricopeptide (TPR) repeat protein
MLTQAAAGADAANDRYERLALYRTYLMCGKTQSQAKDLSLHTLQCQNSPLVQAIALTKRHEYEKALALLKPALAAKAPDLYVMLGACYMSVDKPDAALACYIKVKELSPSNPYIVLAISMIQARLDRFADAAASVKEAKAMCPQEIPLLAEAQGFIDLRQDKYQDALVHFKHEIELDPDRADAYYYSARCLNHLNRDVEAIDQLTHATQLDPDNNVFHAMRGVVLQFQKKFPDAIAEYSEAERLDPRNPNPPEWKGDCYLGLNNWSKAVEQYQKASAFKQQVADGSAQKSKAVGAPHDSSPAMHVDSELPINNTCLNPEGADVYTGAQRARQLLPDVVRQSLHNFGVSIVIAPSVQQFVQTNALAPTPGQCEQLASAAGLYEPSTKKCIVAEHLGIGWTAPHQADYTPLALHELGHAYDECMGSPSTSLRCKLLYARDCQALSAARRPSYQWYFDQGEHGPDQLFADLFAVIYCGKTSLMVSEQLIKKDFGTSFEYMNSFCPKVPQSCQKPDDL